MRFHNGHHHNPRADHCEFDSGSSFSDSLRSYRDRDRDRRPNGRGRQDNRHGHQKQEASGHRQFRHRERADGEVRFCSRSEGACAILLEKYVPGFKLQEGVTFQIAIGQNHRGHTLTVDFLVNGVLFEYHAVRFWRNSKNYGDFKDYHEYRDYRRALAKLPKHMRKAFEEETKGKLAHNYYDKRRAFLDTNPAFQPVELMVAISPGDFYEKIIKRFGTGFPKDKGVFNTEFQKCLGMVVADYETPSAAKPEKGRRGRRSRD